MNFLIRYINQIVLFSGQFAIFYLFLQVSKDGVSFFDDTGHFALLIALIVQTYVLVKLQNLKLRFLASFISPLIYTIFETDNFFEWILEIGHFFFWFYSFVIASLQYINESSSRKVSKIVTEFLITFINVSIFIFIYFVSSLEEYDSRYIYISHFWEAFGEFLSDSSHLYLSLAGFFLALTIALSRLKIILLNEKISMLLDRYIDKKIKNKILNSKTTQNQSENLVIMFSDIRGFTNMSESNSAINISKILNLFFTTWNKLISKRDGIISKFIGDEVMIIFGLESDIKTAINSSVLASIEFIENHKSMNRELKSENLDEIEGFGIGINSGEVVIGNIGGDNRFDYTVIGDSVNIASRVQSLCKKYPTKLIITDIIYQNLENNLKERFESVGFETLKGKTQQIEIFALL